jgi:hypothetical protein
MRMTTPTTLPPLNLETARGELRRLGCYGLAAHAETLLAEPWLARVIEIEDAERARRSLKRRLDNSRLGAVSARIIPPAWSRSRSLELARVVADSVTGWSNVGRWSNPS